MPFSMNFTVVLAKKLREIAGNVRVHPLVLIEEVFVGNTSQPHGWEKKLAQIPMPSVRAKPRIGPVPGL